MSSQNLSSTAQQMGMRDGAGPFCQALINAAHNRGDIVGLSADVSKYTDMSAFAKTFPERFLNVGMAEQNLVMVAAGAARSGLVPVATTFAAFMTRRATDFIVMQVALPKANVKLIGAVPGITTSFGPSHTSIDDLAAMRAIPNLTVIDPADVIECGEALTAALDHDGPVYLRQPFFSTMRAQVSNDVRTPFRIGKNVLLRDGGDIGIVASSYLVEEALHAADTLAAEGIQASVLKVSTLKPFDEVSVAELAARVPHIVTAENHSIFGGLFSAVSEVLARHGIATRVTPIGIQDVFPPFGARDYLASRLKMDSAAIAEISRLSLQEK